ncbi:MCE family protein [bacterium]|nr:MCE family protein [bacterium]
MASELHKTRVGIFVCVGFALIIAALLIWSHISWGGSPRTYSCYFGESVQGLTVSSPVRFRGITVGQVSHIGIAPDGELAEIFFEITPASGFSIEVENMYIHITGNLLTGIKYLEIEMIGDRPKPNRTFPFEPEYPPVGTYHTVSAEDIFYQLTKFLDDLNVKSISTSITNILDGLQKVLGHNNLAPLVSNVTVTSQNIKEITESLKVSVTRDNVALLYTNLNQAVENFREVSATLENNLSDAAVSNIVDNITETTAKVRQSVDAVSPEDIKAFADSLQKLIVHANMLVNMTSEEVEDLMNEVQRAAVNVRAFTEALRARPGQTLFGEDKEKGK